MSGDCGHGVERHRERIDRRVAQVEMRCRWPARFSSLQIRGPRSAVGESRREQDHRARVAGRGAAEQVSIADRIWELAAGSAGRSGCAEARVSPESRLYRRASGQRMAPRHRRGRTRPPAHQRLAERGPNSRRSRAASTSSRSPAAASSKLTRAAPRVAPRNSSARRATTRPAVHRAPASRLARASRRGAVLPRAGLRARARERQSGWISHGRSPQAVQRREVRGARQRGQDEGSPVRRAFFGNFLELGRQAADRVAQQHAQVRWIGRRHERPISGQATESAVQAGHRRDGDCRRAGTAE